MGPTGQPKSVKPSPEAVRESYASLPLGWTYGGLDATGHEYYIDPTGQTFYAKPTFSPEEVSRSYASRRLASSSPQDSGLAFIAPLLLFFMLLACMLYRRFASTASKHTFSSLRSSGSPRSYEHGGLTRV